MHTRVAVSRPTSLNTTDRTDLERADKHLDTSNLILLAIHQAPKKRWPDPHDGLVPRHGRLEHRLENRPSLDDVKLGAVETPRRRLEQSRLEQLDRRRDAKQGRELYPIVPRTVTRQHLLPSGSQDRNLLKQRNQIHQQPVIKRLAVLERHHDPPRALHLQRNMQRLEVIVEIFPALPLSVPHPHIQPTRNSHPDPPRPPPPRYPPRPSPPPG